MPKSKKQADATKPVTSLKAVHRKTNWHVPKWLRMQGRTDDGAMLCRSHGSNWEERLEALEFRRREINCHIDEKHRGWGFGCNGRPTQSSLARLWPYMDEPGPWGPRPGIDRGSAPRTIFKGIPKCLLGQGVYTRDPRHVFREKCGQHICAKCSA